MLNANDVIQLFMSLASRRSLSRARSRLTNEHLTGPHFEPNELAGGAQTQHDFIPCIAAALVELAHDKSAALEKIARKVHTDGPN